MFYYFYYNVQFSQSACLGKEMCGCALVRSDMLCNMTTLYIKDNDHSVGYDVLV